MREILFRGKNTLDGKWVYGDLEKFTRDFLRIVDHKILEHGKTIIPETVGQFTGLTDKNGTKIFEGDIVRYTRKNWLEPLYECKKYNLVSLHRIFFNEKCGAFWEEHIDVETKRVVGSGLLRFNDIRAEENIVEVIGNIHDNPELLKGGDTK